AHARRGEPHGDFGRGRAFDDGTAIRPGSASRARGTEEAGARRGKPSRSGRPPAAATTRGASRAPRSRTDRSGRPACGPYGAGLPAADRALLSSAAPSSAHRMGEHQVTHVEEQQLRSFMRALLADVHALERMLEQDMFEIGVQRIGAEQEMFLIDQAGRPVPLALPILDKLGGPSGQFTLELAQFNLETNLAPRVLAGTCF